MAKTAYSTAAHAVSGFLNTRTWTRSQTVRGRLANEHTQGFTVRHVLGETVVEWREDSRSYGRAGYFEPTLSMDERLALLTKTLEDRYTVARREDTLIVSRRVLTGPETLFFKKVQGALGLEYSAETSTHRYVVRRHPEDNSKWELKVWTLKAVGTLDPIMIADKVVYATCDDAKKYMIAEAFEYLKKISN